MIEKVNPLMKKEEEETEKPRTPEKSFSPARIKDFLLVNRSTGQTIIKNTVWLGVSNVGGRLLRAVVIIFAARVLGAEEWGAFSYALSLVAFLTIFVDFGVNAILMRESARNTSEEKKSQILSTVFFMKAFLLAVAVGIILYFGPKLVRVQNAEAILPIVSLILIFDTLRQFGFSLNQTLERMEREAGLFITTNAAIVVFGMIFLGISPTIRSFAWAYALGTGVGMIATFYALRDHLKRIFLDFKYKLIRSIIASAWPFAISGALSILMINTDIILIGLLLPAKEVGFYSAADRIIQTFYILPSILAASILPTFSRLAQKDDAKFRVIMEKVISTTLAIAIPIAIGGLILGNEIMVQIFGADYKSGGMAFKILALTLAVNFPAVILSNAIFAYDKQRKLIINAAIGGVLNVLFDLLLIPIWGIAGSAIATLAAMIISNFYLWHSVKKMNDFRVWPKMGRIFLASGTMAAFTFGAGLMGWNVFLIIGFSAAIYFGVLRILKEPLLKEAKMIITRSQS